MRSRDWFRTLTGFQEGSVSDVADHFVIDGPTITSKANGRRMHMGSFEMVSLAELRERTEPIRGKRPVLREVSADISDVHCVHGGAFIQAASQFNCLEMFTPTATPEDGITIYEHDNTQGPACAIACGAGTIYRNYFVPVGDGIGQTANRQLNGLADLAAALGEFIEVRNGYAWPTAEQLDRISDRLRGLTLDERDELLGYLRIGLQSDTEVTISEEGDRVTQAYCAALPVAYVGHDLGPWEPFARLVLDATYEAAMWAAVDDLQATTVFLTMVGGGAFGNPTSWIEDAIERSIDRVPCRGMDVVLVRRPQQRKGNRIEFEVV